MCHEALGKSNSAQIQRTRRLDTTIKLRFGLRVKLRLSAYLSHTRIHPELCRSARCRFSLGLKEGATMQSCAGSQPQFVPHGFGIAFRKRATACSAIIIDVGICFGDPLDDAGREALQSYDEHVTVRHCVLFSHSHHAAAASPARAPRLSAQTMAAAATWKRKKATVRASRPYTILSSARQGRTK